MLLIPAILPTDDGLSDLGNTKPADWLNLNFALKGIDIALKKPIPPASSADDSYKWFIFRAEPDEEMTFIQANKEIRCDSSFKSSSYQTIKDFVKGSSEETMSDWEVGYTGPEVTASVPVGPATLSVTPVPNSASANSGNTDSNNDYRRFFSSEGGSISRSSIRCLLYVASIDISNHKHFAGTFCASSTCL